MLPVAGDYSSIEVLLSFIPGLALTLLVLAGQCIFYFVKKYRVSMYIFIIPLLFVVVPVLVSFNNVVASVALRFLVPILTFAFLGYIYWSLEKKRVLSQQFSTSTLFNVELVLIVLYVLYRLFVSFKAGSF